MLNQKAENQDNKSRKKWLILTAVFFIFIFIVVGLMVSFEIAYADKFFPKTKIGYLNIGGQTKVEVLNQLKEIEKNFQAKSIKFKGGEKEISINPIMISAADPDLAKPILTFDWPKTVEDTFTLGHSGNWLNRFKDQFLILVFGKTGDIAYNLDQTELLNILKTNFAEAEKPPVDAKLIIRNEKAEVTGESSGYVFNYEKSIERLVKNLKKLDFSPISFDLEFREPQIKKEFTGSAINSLDKILAIKSLKLKNEQKTWEISRNDFIPWLEFQLKDKEIIIGLNKEKTLEFLKTIAEEINIEGKDAKFKLENGRVTEFVASQDGKALNLELTYEMMNNQIIFGEAKDIELVVEVAPAQIETGDLNNLGIKELLGQGTSNFAGSPKNRRFNIAVGAGSLNGILIKPGEEFSLLKALGPIDGAHGYKQELVIKGNRTIPEYGGGLCQIGTTTFRAALYSGLPITQRQNHSYRVVYYEPAGMDATIYDPAPDLRFINDTGNNILFVTRISGDNLIFEFYGTKDGRQAKISPNPPSIYNVTKPGEPHYIETEDLKPGEKKQLEKPHNGADTYFKYTIIYPNGEEKVKEFGSHYVAWPEVWLVGKEPSATSTDATVLVPEQPTE